MKKKITLFLAGGGTGGHIYPALAVAEKIRQLEPSADIHFVGTRQGLETSIVIREKYPLHLLSVGKLNLSGQWFTKLKTLALIPWAFLQSVLLILRYRPDYVLGVGGYASGPFVLMAALMGRRTGIWEANAYPGLANRWLSKVVEDVFLVFESAQRYLSGKNIQVVGVPVRGEIETHHVEKTDSSSFHVLHFGGSQGSRAIGTALSEAILQKPSWLESSRVVHQAGRLDYETFRKKYESVSEVEVFEFIFEMPKYYRWADLVICRGGASTLNEIAAFGLPAVVIPLPAADGHQEKNAQILAENGAARMILQKDLTPEKLSLEIEELKRNPELRKSLAREVKKFYKPEAARKISEHIVQRLAETQR